MGCDCTWLERVLNADNAILNSALSVARSCTTYERVRNTLLLMSTKFQILSILTNSILEKSNCLSSVYNIVKSWTLFKMNFQMYKMFRFDKFKIKIIIWIGARQLRSFPCCMDIRLKESFCGTALWMVAKNTSGLFSYFSSIRSGHKAYIIEGLIWEGN